MRRIEQVIVHCTATRASRLVHVSEVIEWHKARGWRTIGYHNLIHQDGRVSAGRPYAQAGAHAVGHNARSLGFCYVGGLDDDGAPEDTRTLAQRIALRAVILDACREYPIRSVIGHSCVGFTLCPGFDARLEYADLIDPILGQGA